MSGAAEAGTLSLNLESADGQSLASLDYLSAKSSGGTSAKSLSVGKVSGALPDFSLPDTLTPGSYRLVATLYSLSGAQLSTSESVFYIADAGFNLGSLSLYPPTPAPGSAVLLSAEPQLGSAAGVSATAYLKWYANGKLFSEGLLSEGRDRVVWRAPQADGAYTLSVELYPAKPPAVSQTSGSSAGSPWRQDIKAIVSKSAGAGDEYSDAARFVSKFDFEGDFSDSGTRVQSEKPASFGKPVLAAYPGGFGYHFDAESGVNAAGALPKSSRFTLLSRFYSEKESGDLIRFSSADGTAILQLGIERRQPFVEIRDAAGNAVRSSPSGIKASVQPGLVNLALSFEPDGENCRLVWSIDGKRFDSAPIPRISFPQDAKCLIGGASALEAVYDETAISDDSESGPPPLYAAAALRKYGADLYIATGFEATSVPADCELSGNAACAPRKLSLSAGAGLAFTEVLPSARALHLEADFGAKSPSSLRFVLFSTDDLKTPLFSVDAAGTIHDAAGKDAGLIPLESPASLVFSLKSVEGGFELSSASGLPVAHVAAEGSTGRLELKISNIDKAEPASLSRLLVRAAPEYLSLAPGSHYARANNK